MNIPDMTGALVSQMVQAGDPMTQSSLAIVQNAIEERSQNLAVQRLELIDTVQSKINSHAGSCPKCKAAGDISADCLVGSLVLNACKAAMGSK